MNKTEKRTWKNGNSTARRGRLLVLVILALAVIAALTAVGRQVVTMAQKDESLFNKLERTVKAKEPSWKLVQKNERKGAQEKYFTQDWGLGDEYVSTITYERANAEDAAKAVAEIIHSPISAPVRITKVPGLGDEAYTIGDSPYGKKGAGTLIVRRDNIVLRLDTSSLQAAKRFARHMLDEIDAK